MDSNHENGTLQITVEKAKTIVPINKDVVHRICSGQVVLSLAIAVKELVENSLDAGATLVEVRLKEYGMDSVEVSDNGGGVVEENFAALTLKYHTSKLREFTDLVEIKSFGFRGEALSSLCALSDVTITTRHKSTNYATKISYDNKGEIKQTSPCSRQIGTTVTLLNLFATLPVRQKEFHKNIKREFARMTQILYAYCLVSEGIKIICTNQTKKGTKTVVVATQGTKSIRENISCVFGIKQLDSLLELKPKSPTSYIPNLKEKLLSQAKSEPLSQSEGDNSPCEPLQLSEDSEDAPDDFLASSSLTLTPESQEIEPGTVEFVGYVSSCAHGAGRSTSDRQFYYINSRPCDPVKIMKLFNETYRQHNPHQYPFVFLNLKVKGSSVDVNVTPDKRQVFLEREKNLIEILKVSLYKLYQNIPSMVKVNNEDKKQIVSNSEAPKLQSFLNKFINKTTSTMNNENSISDEATTDKKRKSMMDSFVTSHKIMKIENNVSTDENSDANTETNSETNTVANTDIKIENEDLKKEVVYLSFGDLPATQIRTVEEVMMTNASSATAKKESPRSKPCAKTKHSDKSITTTEFSEPIEIQRKVSVVKTSIDHIKSLMAMPSAAAANQLNKIKFKATITPGTNRNCEQELQKELSKDLFEKMRIIGQFNLGFIITELDDDLFIIDQHATDEKYNFETLQRSTILTNQKLIIPQQLELTGVNEQILMENLELFKKNGFTFNIDENAPPTKKVKLLTIPLSNNWIFGKDDIEEVLFMIKESGPTETCRPSRIRSMFASRACRKSVMIGMALSKADMRKLIDHMGMIEQPWNCPHGRPTIRHLINIALTTN